MAGERADAAPAPGDAASDERRLLGILQRLLAIDAADVKGALDGASNLLAEAFGADKIDALLHDPATDSLVAVGASDTPMGRRQRALGLDRLPLAGGGRMVEVFRTWRPYLCADARQDPVVLAGFRDELGIRSLLAVPLEVDGARRGVLQAAAAAPGRFADRDLRFLAAVARWVGIVAHRAELAEGLAREAAERGQHLAAEELVTVLAHDLRTHLTPLTGQLDLIRWRAEREGRVRDIASAGAAARSLARLNDLITDLLDAGRLERGLFALAPRPVDLAALAREVALALPRGVTPIRVDGAETLPALADPDRLRQALENLLGNAVRHTPAGTAVELTVAAKARPDGTWAVLTVADYGPGIPPAMLPRLFGRFAPGPGSTGLGLGLYLASRIAAAHGGTLTVDSAPGAGARFHLALPVAGTGDGALPRQLPDDIA